MKRTQKRVSSFRKKAILTISIIVIPLFIAISLFVALTMRNQQEAVRNARLGTLSAYQAQIENTVLITESYLQNIVANNIDFQSIVYARTKTEAYVSSEAVAKTLHPLLRSNELLGGFYTYSGKFDYFRADNITSYPISDASLIRAAVIDAAANGSMLSDWKPVNLLDRTVLLSTAVFQETAVAAVIDPGKQSFSGLDDGGLIFSIMPDGSPYADSLPFAQIPVTASDTKHSIFQDTSGSYFNAVMLPLTAIEGYIVYAAPYSLFQYLSMAQIILLLAALFLLSSIPVCWLTFRRVLLEPLNSLTAAMQAIQNGNTDIRVQPESEIQEVNEISGTVNTMLDTLRQQKIDSYEQQLQIQHAQLQYLHLQIRPHFYLNCLNMIFSMAEEKNCSGIQDVVLDLSAYLRSMFRDSAKLVPLITELHSVESYIRIQQVGVEKKPQYKLDMDPEVADVWIPPLSILTFVENSFKHNKCEDTPLEIRIKCEKIVSEDGCWLNITVSDNCGGVSEEQLQQLNSTQDSASHEKKVGILNTRQRFQLLYGDKVMLSFRNQTEGLCVELFLPLE